MSNILVFDTETTSLDTDKAELLEIAFQVVDISGSTVGKMMNTFVYTKSTIPKEITDINRITNDMIIGAPLPEKVVAVMEKHVQYYNVKAIAAHNAFYDINVMDKYVSSNSCIRDTEIIDTLRLARRLYPNVENHKLGTLKEELGLSSGDVLGDLHAASFDVAITCSLLETMMEKLCEITTLEEIMYYHDTPFKFDAIPFGKHKGTLWKDIPKGYLQWLISIREDLDYDTQYTLDNLKL